MEGSVYCFTKVPVNTPRILTYSFLNACLSNLDQRYFASHHEITTIQKSAQDMTASQRVSDDLQKGFEERNGKEKAIESWHNHSVS